MSLIDLFKYDKIESIKKYDTFDYIKDDSFNYYKDKIDLKIIKNRYYHTINKLNKYSYNFSPIDRTDYRIVIQVEKMVFKYSPAIRVDIGEWISERFKDRPKDYWLWVDKENNKYSIIQLKKVADAVEFKLTFVGD